MPLTLDEVVPWGRSFDEYRRMFGLTPSDLARPILGCADGPASFNAEAIRQCCRVCSCDPLYAFSAEEIRNRMDSAYHVIMQQTEQNRGDFAWTEFSSPQAMGVARMAAMESFLEDYPAGLAEGRYIAAELPALPFVTATFDLAICSHFLFLYSRQTSADFHVAAIDELLRVSRKVRIFPLLNLAGRRSEHLDPVLNHLREQDVFAAIEPVSYEFVKGANRMLRIRRSQQASSSEAR